MNKKKIDEKSVKKIVKKLNYNVPQKIKRMEKNLWAFRKTISKHMKALVDECKVYGLPFDILFIELLSVLRDMYIGYTQSEAMHNLNKLPPPLKKEMTKLINKIEKEVKKVSKSTPKEEEEEEEKLSYIG